MAVVHSQDSGYAKEMRKWNAYPSEYGPGERPFQHYDYPAMLYRAKRGPDGRVTFESVVVNDEDERDREEDRGFAWGGQGKALEKLEASELEIAKLAANLNHQARVMSPKAAAEIEAAQAAAGARHLPMVPETPIKRRGRKPKAQTSEVQP